MKIKRGLGRHFTLNMAMMAAFVATGCERSPDSQQTQADQRSAAQQAIEDVKPGPGSGDLAVKPAPSAGDANVPPPTPAPKQTDVAPAVTPPAQPEPPAIEPPPLTKPEDPRVAAFGGLTAPKPATWLWQPPGPAGPVTPIVQYAVPARNGGDQARIAVFKAGGSVDANIQRWRGQFRTADRSAVEPEIDTLEVDGMTVTLVEFAGEYSGMGGIFTPNQLFIAAIVQDAPEGQIVIRFVGPTTTVEANRDGFMKMILGLRRAEPQK